MYCDCHVHLALNGENTKKHIEILKKRDSESKILIKNLISLYKEGKITKLRDGGDYIGAGSFIRDICNDEDIVYKTPIKAFYKEGYYGKLLGEPITDISDFRKKFNVLLKENPDFIKIIYTGLSSLKEYGKVREVGFSNNEIKYIIDACHEKGLKVMIHANSSRAVLKAIKYGADTIEHGYYLNDEIFYAMKENSVFWVPTLAPFGNMLYHNRREFKEYENNIMRIFHQQQRNVKNANDIGVKIAIGSDSGSRIVQHGRGFFDELIYLSRAGILKDDIEKIKNNTNEIFESI